MAYGATGALSPRQSGYDIVQAPRYSQDKMRQMEELRGIIEPGYKQGLGDMSRLAGGDQSYFEQLEAPAMRQFGELQGNIASRFSQGGDLGAGGAGSMGARHSSGFQNTMSGQASNLAERLMGQRMGLQQNALSQLSGLYSELTQDPYEMYIEEKKRRNGWGNALSGAVSGATAGSAFGPWGTAIGGGIGALGGYFGGRQ